MSFVSSNFFNYGANGNNHAGRPVAKCAVTAPARSVVTPTKSWANWKNAVSGEYNRELCALPCAQFKGYPQETAGDYRATVKTYPATQADAKCQADLALRRALYRDTRMSNTSKGVCGYRNYLDYSGRRTQGFPPVQVDYTPGWWPDELNSFMRCTDASEQ